MIRFLYPTGHFDYSIYNQSEDTFTSSKTNSCWSFEWILSQVGLCYKRLTACQKLCYVIFNLNLPTEFSDLQNIPEDIWKKISTESNVYLLLYQATEATPFYYWKYRWNKLRDFLISRNIPSSKIKYICGDIDAAENHLKHKDDYWSNINVLGLDVFEIIHLARHLSHSNNNYLNSISGYLKNKNKKSFLNLNNRMRPNKQALIFYLKKYRYYETNLVSNLWNDSSQLIDKEHFNSVYNFDQSNYEDFKNIVPVRREIDNDPDATQNSPEELYIQTNFSLVSETYTGSSIRFITEKTYKPILMGHPFLIYGNAGTIRYLKERGYETFPELFDESYDNLIDTKDQLRSIINNLNNDFFLSPIVKEKIIYNQQHFLQQHSKSILSEKIKNFL